MRPTLSIIAIALVCSFAIGNTADKHRTRTDWTIRKAAVEAGVPTDHLSKLCFTESSHRAWVTGDLDKAFKAHGLCQIQTRTARDRGFKGEVKDLYDPEINAKYAAKQLKYCYNHFKTMPRAFDCYNKGYGWVKGNIGLAGYTRYALAINN